MAVSDYRYRGVWHKQQVNTTISNIIDSTTQSHNTTIAEKVDNQVLEGEGSTSLDKNYVIYEQVKENQVVKTTVPMRKTI